MSLGQELRDFVGSFQAGYKLARSPDEKAYDQARTEGLQAQTALSQAAVEDLPAERDYRRAQIEHLRAQTGQIGKPAPMNALDAENTRSLINARDAETAVNLGYDPTHAGVIDAARAAFPQQAVDSGASPAPAQAPKGEGLNYTGVPQQSGAMSAVNAMATGGEIPQAPGAAPTQDITRLAFDAVRGAMEQSVADAGFQQTAVPDGTTNLDAARDYISGKGAAPASLVMEVGRVIDPEGTMTESERNLKSMGFVWQHYMNQGQPEKAKAAASQLLQFYRVASQRYAAVAQAAAEGGNIDGAVEGLVKAYAYVPDGKDLKIVKTDKGYAWQMLGSEQGRQSVLQEGIMSPKEMAAAAMNVSPANFDEFLFSAAGEKLEADTRAADAAFEGTMTGLKYGIEPDPEMLARMSKDDQDRVFQAQEKSGWTPENLAKITEQVDTAMQDFEAGFQGQELPPYLQESIENVSTAAQGLMLNKTNKITARQAVQLTGDMLMVDETRPTQARFEFEKTPDGMGVRVKTAGHPAVTMRIDDFQTIYGAWRAASQTRVEEIGQQANRDEQNAIDLGTVTDALGRLSPSGLQPGAPPAVPPSRVPKQSGQGIALPEVRSGIFTRDEPPATRRRGAGFRP